MAVLHLTDRQFTLDALWAPMRAARIGWAAGLAAWALYLSGLSPLVHTFDPAQFQTLARTGGIAHSGYPTLVILLQGFAQFPFGTLAWRANLLSACAGAVAVGLLAYAAARWTRRPPLAFAAALAFALSFTMWKESSLAGVHALTLAVDAAIFLLALHYAHRPSLRVAVGTAFLFGVGLTCHLTVLGLALPALLAFVLGARAPRARLRHVVGALLGLALGLTPFAGTLAADRPDRTMNYLQDTLEPDHPLAVEGVPDFSRRLARLRWLVTGEQYLSVSPRDGRSVAARAVYLAADLALNELPGPGLALAVAGLALLLRRGGTPTLLLGTWFAGSVVLVFVGASNLTSRFFFLPGTWVLALGLAWALARLAERHGRLAMLGGALLLVTPIARLAWREPPPVVARAPMLGGIWSLWPSEWSPWVPQSRYDHYGRGVLARLEPRAVVLGSGWDESCTLRYLTLGERLRPDVDVRLTGRRDPRLSRSWREAARAGRPAYVTRLPLPGEAPDVRAVPVWHSGWQGIWRLEPATSGSPPADSARPEAAFK